MFNPSAPLPPLSLRSGLERSNSKLKKEFSKLVASGSGPGKPRSATMPISSSSPRSFLKNGMMRGLHRKQKSGDSVATTTTPMTTTPKDDPIATLSTPSLLGNEGSQTESPRIRTPLDEPIDASMLNGIYDGESPSTEDALRNPSLFEGLSDYHVDLNSHQSLIDPAYLKNAFGITLDDNAGLGLSNVGSSVIPLTDEESHDEESGAKSKKRPRIQVTIPVTATRVVDGARLRNPKVRQAQDSDSLVTPQSTTSQPPFTGVATARLSIISPLSVVEMPRPRRPFSTVSLEGMTVDSRQQNLAALPHSSQTVSTEFASDHDGKSSNSSARSSMSSMLSDPAVGKGARGTRPRAGQHLSSSESVAADMTRQPVNRSPRVMQSATSLREFSAANPVRTKSLRSKRSATSLNSSGNLNKPLPPEPGLSSGPPPVTLYGSSPSRSGTLNSSRHRPNGSGSASGSCGNSTLSRRPSKNSTLRSKYTPKDLDALDDAFQRNMPLKDPTPGYYTEPSSPSSSQTLLPVELQLGTISEASPPVSMLFSKRDTVQISRGPMRMEPSRPPPAPPAALPPPTLATSAPPSHHDYRKAFSSALRSGSPVSTIKAVSENPTARRKPSKRSIGSIHVATQIRPAECLNQRHPTAVLIANSKANRVLGKDDGIPLPRCKPRRSSIDSLLSSEESDDVRETESPAEYGEESESEFARGRPDPHTEEIRRRLEILSPKEDPAAVFIDPAIAFLAFAEDNVTARAKIESAKENAAATLSKPFSYDPVSDIPFIAELEAARSPSPVELEAIEVPIAELGPGSPIPSSAKNSMEAARDEERASSSSSEATPTQRLPLPSKARPRPTTQIRAARSIKGRSLVSIAAAEVPAIHDEPLPTKRVHHPSMSAEEVEQLISADAAERVLLRILESLENLMDLFAAARVSRGFYRTFKRHELPLIKGALWSMSPAAWELREMSIPFSELPKGAKDYCPTYYLKHYIRDLYIVIELKSLFMLHCQPYLRPETIRGLSGETDESLAIDDALWRVWTFCRIFGCGKGREDDMLGQMDWLRGGPLAKLQTRERPPALAEREGTATNSVLFNPPKGFARGNHGITPEELYDMMEIWECLGALVRGYLGKREDARQYGVFDKVNVAPGDVVNESAILEEWTYHLLTLAPTAVLDISSPTAANESTWSRTRSKGFTSWTPPPVGTSRSRFLYEAVSRVRDEKRGVYNPSLSTQSSRSTMGAAHANTPPMTPTSLTNASSDLSLASRSRLAATAAANSLTALNTSLHSSSPVEPSSLHLRSAKTLPVQGSLASIVPDEIPIATPSRTKTRITPPRPQPTHRPSLVSKASKILGRRRPEQKASTSSFSSVNSSKQHKTSLSASHAQASSSSSPSDSTALLPPSTSASAQAFPTTTTTDNSNTLTLTLSAQGIIPVLPHDGESELEFGARRQVRDPVDVAVDQLVAMGYEEGAAKRALAESDRGDRVDFGKAVKSLEREKRKKELKARLDKMG